MKLTKLFLLLFACLLSQLVHAQSGNDFSTYKRGGGGGSGFSSSLFSLEPYLGASASLARGELVDYQRAFLDVSETGTDFRGGIRPLVMGTGGLQVRVSPFSGGLEHLSFSLGLQYLQTGFRSQFEMTHNSPAAFTDVIRYNEIYRHNYWAVPIHVRWGGRVFASLGATFCNHVNSTRTQKLYHKQDGSGALNGGFNTRENQRWELEEQLLRSSLPYFSLGAGFHFTERLGIMARAHFGGDILNETPRNYRATVFELSFFNSFNL
jgi:hypothetical protein